jgi:hypothetical protein
MPGNNSWNGKWSGEGRFYGIIRSFSDKSESPAKILNNNYYDYDFGDGWRAAVEVKLLNNKDVRKTRKMLEGFCGYDWMVDSIIKNGSIKT